MSVYLSKNLILREPEVVEQPLTHARIGYKTIVTRDNITGSSEAEAFPARNLANPATFERWRPTSMPADVVVDAGAPVEVDYVGIAAHNVGTQDSAVTIDYSDDAVNWIAVISRSPSDNRALMLLFEPITARYWRIRFTGSNIVTVGVVYIGKALAMERPIYGGHSPITLSRISTVRPSVSERGQWLGASVERRGLASTFAWQHLTPQWYRQNFDPFVESNPRVHPFFIAWRPLRFPREVAYCWASEDIQPQNMGIGRGLMDVSMSVEGFADAPS